MGQFIDFDELKSTVTYEQVIALLGIPMTRHGNQWRGPCPACHKGGDRTLVVTEQRGYFCFAKKAGGDVIALYAHVKGVNVKRAAEAILEGVNAPPPPQETEEEEDDAPAKNMQPLAYLDHTHEAVIAIGFDPDVAAKLGIGYAKKGLMRGTVAIPIRDERGHLVGYIGADSALRLPPDFQTNVVQLNEKRRA